MMRVMMVSEGDGYKRSEGDGDKGSEGDNN